MALGNGQTAKQFQEATADYIVEQLNKKNRFLLADEVGLGKTIIAKTVIEKMQEKSKKNKFTVLYVCSNEVLADQNCKKLGMCAPKNVNECRLSMLHLKIQELENQQNGKLLLIPMTTNTSFKLRGVGSAEERALAALLLATYKTYKTYKANANESPDCNSKIEIEADYASDYAWLMKGRKCEKNWKKDDNTGYFYTQKSRLDGLKKDSDQDYINNMCDYIEKYMEESDSDLQSDIDCLLDKMHTYISQKKNSETDSNANIDSLRNAWWEKADNTNQEMADWLDMWKDVVCRVRKMFAGFTQSMLNADLIVMDEFQRYEELLETGENQSESAKIFQEFGKNTKMLLLSATPYNLRAGEQEKNKSNDKFLHMMQSLMPDHDNRKEYEKFESAWNSYVDKMREFEKAPNPDNKQQLLTDKKAVEEMLYSCMCRTERRSEQMIDTSKVKNMKDVMMKDEKDKIDVLSYDVHSYIELKRFVDIHKTEFEESAKKNKISNYHFRMDYVKSTPFLLSFMVNTNDYAFKNVFDSVMENHAEIRETVAEEMPHVLLESDIIENYKKLPANNARLTTLFREVFGNDSDSGNENFHPERLLWIPASNPYYSCDNTVFQACAGYTKTLIFSKWQTVPRAISTLTSYEAERRARKSGTNEGESGTNEGGYHASRNEYLGDKDAKELIAYPSVWLADVYGKRKQKEAFRNTIQELKEDIRNKIETDICGFGIEKFNQISSGAKDILSFLTEMDRIYWVEKKTGESDIDAGKKADILDILVNIAIASPAVCLYREVLEMEPKQEIRKIQDSVEQCCKNSFVSLFNKPEIKQIMEAVYPDEKPNHAKVFQYCVDGNLQSVLDEYRFALGVSDREGFLKAIGESFLQTTTLDYVPAEAYMGQSNDDSNKKSNKMRMHFAVGYFDIKSSDNKSVVRAKNIQTAFNSPFWPFVLTTTSVGQEGLDFHLYCRKIMHWNLPSNPIDFEQREGRINRYLCHAIRQNVAQEEDFLWEDKFISAKKSCNDSSELMPYWCLPESYLEKTPYKIERIVPMYPFSQDEIQYQRIKDVLANYRMTLGQPDPEALALRLGKADLSEQERENLIFNLSPYERKRKEKQGNR